MTEKTFIIAELSANHNNDFDLAVKTIEAISKSGADAVKVQTYKPESLTLDLDTGFFAPRTNGLWKGYTPWKLFKEAAMPYEWQPKLKLIAEKLGLVFFSSPFDFEAVDFLEKINNPIYKIASFEITDIPLIEYIASKGKPIIISTGVAEKEDILLALDACERNNNRQISLLKCTSQYPAKIADANLLSIPEMITSFNLTIGVSDHTMGDVVPIMAVTLGAKIVEKHFILDRSLKGPDSEFSMEPEEFSTMVSKVRDVESALGIATFYVSTEDKNRRRSLFVTNDIKKGEVFTTENIRSIRPGYGMHPLFLNDVLGKKATCDLSKGTPLNTNHIEQSF